MTNPYLESETRLAFLFALILPGSAWASHRHNLGGVEAEGRYSVEFPFDSALPNTRLTPGATNLAVSQVNLADTICRKGGYTKSIRPPENYTERLKRMQIRQYCYTEWMDVPVKVSISAIAAGEGCAVD